ncbi:MAG: hypothetical protein ABIR92_06570 [Gemmatimonadaceae bacterium]
MKSLTSALALVVFALPAAAQTFNPGKLPAASRDSFEVVYQGQPIGSFVLALAKAGDNYSYTGIANLAAMGVTETDSVVFNGATLAPVSMHNRGSMQGMSTASSITVAGGKATGTAQRPGPNGIESIAVDAMVEPGVLADGAEIALLPTIALSEGFSATFQTLDGKSGKIKKYDLKVLANEKITISLGTFETFKVQLTGEETISVFITTAEPRRIVLMRIEGPGIEMRRTK